MARPDPQDLEALEAELEAKSLRDKEARLQELNDIAWLMGQKEGRRIMARLLDKAGIHRTTFRSNSEMPFLEGMRNLGLIFFSDMMESAPQGFIQLMQEQKEAKEHERSS